MNRRPQENKIIYYGLGYFFILGLYITRFANYNVLNIAQVAIALFVILFYIPQTQECNWLIRTLLTTGWFLHYGEVYWTVLNLNKVLSVVFLIIAMCLSHIA